MYLYDLVNTLSNGRFEKYLEIGVDYGTTFNKVDIPHRVGVDPVLKIPVDQLKGEFYGITSDEYFAAHRDKFDCILIDGLHTYAQSRQDFINALAVLNEGGVIILDDCYPADDLAALPDLAACLKGRVERGTPEDMTWMGDVYKTVLWLNDTTSYAYAYVKETRGYVVVWPHAQRRRQKWFSDEQAIAECDYNRFKSLTLPVMSLSRILSEVQSGTFVTSLQFWKR